MIKMSPVFVVDEIEPCLPFWTERLGFTKTLEIPDGERIGFAILAREGVEIMYQSRSSLRRDMPDLPDDVTHASTVIHIEVSDFATVIDALDGADVVVEPRRTFYGGVEMYIREPGGNLVAFSGITSRDGRTATDMGL